MSSVPPVTVPTSMNTKFIGLFPTIVHRLHSVLMLGSEYSYIGLRLVSVP